MAVNLTDQAIKLLVEKRWPMLPSAGPSKGPCVAWKEFQERLPTPEQLREWGRRFTVKRWGLVTGKLSGIVVLDLANSWSTPVKSPSRQLDGKSPSRRCGSTVPHGWLPIESAIRHKDVNRCHVQRSFTRRPSPTGTGRNPAA
jgi:hypothetical protein